MFCLVLFKVKAVTAVRINNSAEKMHKHNMKMFLKVLHK